MRDFKLSEKFLDEYKGKQPLWGFGALSYITYKRTYARTKEDGTTEEFWETLQRVTEGCFTIQKEHCDKFKLPWDNKKAQRSAQVMFKKMWDFKFIPPGRGLWMMGTEAIYKKGSGGLQNCGAVSSADIAVDFANPFIWAMDFLMLGVGIGFDLEGAKKITIQKPAPNTGQKYIIPDTREGWIEALRLTLVAFKTGCPIPEYDFSLIRGPGVPIKTFGGTSSGPEPLKQLLKSVYDLLIDRVDAEITSVDIVDLFNFIGKAVVAGNVRRSAELALGKIDDKDFIECKDYKLYPNELMDRRWASNNSVLVKVGDNYTIPAQRTALNGEPGYIWLDNAKKYSRMKDAPDNKDYRIIGFNPCAEQPLESYELCNLVETFPANHDSPEEFYETLKYAYLYAKTVTLIPSHDMRTNSVMIRNRRIGTSMSGIEQAKKKFGVYKFYSEFCDKGYDVIKQYDRIYSDWLGVARSIKVTTVKPSGTVSLLAGATPGVHAAHSKYYFRTMRLAHNSPLVPLLLKAGYLIEYGATEWKEHYTTNVDWFASCGCDEEVDNDGMCSHALKLEIGDSISKGYWSRYVLENPITIKDPPISNFEGTLVVYFPIEEKDFTKGKEEQTLWEQMENAAKMQYYWSDNSVSVTVNFKPEEVSQIKNALEHYETRLKTVSFLPLENHGYVQAPYITISEKEYKDYVRRLKPLDLITTTSQEDKKIEAGCEGGVCDVKNLS